MTCSEARRQWMLYLDGEGDSATHFEIAEHLDRCGECAAWFERQRRLENTMSDRLAAGDLTESLWDRLHDSLRTSDASRRSDSRGRSSRRFAAWRIVAFAGGTLAAAALLAVGLFHTARPESGAQVDFATAAAELHRQWVDGSVRPEFASTSEIDVDRYFKSRAPFKVHCPPRSDVEFSVTGAGLQSLSPQVAAGFIVGHVHRTPISILVLRRPFPDRASPEKTASPRRAEPPHRKSAPRHERFGSLLIVSAVHAENLVLVTGDAPPGTLERILAAYGSYH